MAVRTPVKIDGSGNIVAMTASDIVAIHREAVRLYGANPSVTLSYVASGGSLGAISDTRYQAGASATSISAFPTEATTAEPSQVTVNYDRVNEAVAGLSAPPDTNNRAFPLYVDGSGNLRSMTLTDLLDTFIGPAINFLTTAGQTTDQAGTYTIHTATSLSGATLISATPIFIDTRADLTLYTAAGIPEVQDQPITITSYYLFRINAATEAVFARGMYMRSDGNLQVFSKASFQSLLSNAVRYFATQAGSRIDYLFGTSSVGSRGSGIVNTNHTGVTGNYQTRLINNNDYRAQEFPNGTPATILTTYLRCLKV